MEVGEVELPWELCPQHPEASINHSSSLRQTPNDCQLEGWVECLVDWLEYQAGQHGPTGGLELWQLPGYPVLLEL